MSLVPTSQAGALAIPDDLMVGMEDFGAKDIVMPRIKIDHKETVFVDSLTGERFDEIEAVLLGLVKSRILWPAAMGGDREAPLCRSYDHEHGTPGEKFPWPKSGFDKPTTVADLENAVLPCDGCALKEFGTHPARENTPWCTEQFVLPLMLPIGEDDWGPAILTLHGASVKPVKAYLTGFKRANSPLFVAKTTLTLEGFMRNENPYAVVHFVKGEETERDLWRGWADQYRVLREYLTKPRQSDDSEGETVSPEAKAQREAQAARDAALANASEEEPW